MAKLDIIIVNDDGIYSLPKDVWMQGKFKIATEFAGDAAVLVKRGALVADIPIPEIPVGFFCFLANLSQLNDAQPIANQPAPDPEGPTPDKNTLLVHVLPNDYYAVPMSVWKSKKIERAGKPPICDESDDGFLINLPRIRNKQ